MVQIAGAVLIAVIAALNAGCSAAPGSSYRINSNGASSSVVQVGTTVFSARAAPRLPALSGPLVGGGNLSLAAEPGHVVVLNFWGSWCSICKDEGPVLATVAAHFKSANVRFVGIDVADNSAGAEAYMHEFHIEYPSLSDPGDAIAPKFHGLVPIIDFPSTLVIASNGKIVARVIGNTTTLSLTHLIEEAERISHGN